MVCVEGVPLYSSCVCYTNREALAWDGLNADSLAWGVPWPRVLSNFSPGAAQGTAPGVWFLRDMFFHPERMASLPAPCSSREQFHWGVVLWDSWFFYAEISVPTPPHTGLKNSSSIVPWDVKTKRIMETSKHSPEYCSICLHNYCSSFQFLLHFCTWNLLFFFFLQAQIHTCFYLFLFSKWL